LLFISGNYIFFKSRKISTQLILLQFQFPSLSEVWENLHVNKLPNHQVNTDIFNPKVQVNV